MRLSDAVLFPEVLEEAKSSSRTTCDAVFAEEPVPLDVFVTDKKFLANPSLSPPQYEAVRYVEQIYYMELYASMSNEFGSYWDPVRMINFATLQWGKGGGKDHVCRIMSLRVAYLLLCLRSPQDYYEMPPQDTIHMLNVASSSGQAQQAFFIPMTRAVKRGWFKDMCSPKLNTISFDKNVEAISGHSEAESQEGLNLMLGIADEIDAFRSKEEVAAFRTKGMREPTKSAEGILKMMRTSASTRFPKTFKNVRISYPRYLGSTIQRLTNFAQAQVNKDPEKARHYVSGPLPTWAVNPRVTGKEDFAEDYEEDPVMAAAMYECKPSGAINPYFRNELAVAASFWAVEREPIEVEYVLVDGAHPKTGLPIKKWQVVFDFDDVNLYPIRGARYALHADIGIRKDGCGIAMSHVSKWVPVERLVTDEEGGVSHRTEQVPVVVTDFIISLVADLTVEPAREIKIRWIKDLIEELERRAFSIELTTFDSYQSTESSQRIEDELGIEVKRLSTDKDPSIYTNLRDLMLSQGVTAPYRDTVHAEILSLQKGADGKIDHPPGGSKDEADAWACSVLGATTVGGAEADDGERRYAGEDEFELVAYLFDDYSSMMD